MDSIARYRNAEATEEVAIYRDEDAVDPLERETWFRFVSVENDSYTVGHEQVDRDTIIGIVGEAMRKGDTVIPLYIESRSHVVVTVGSPGFTDHEGAIIITDAGCAELGITRSSAVEQAKGFVDEYNDWLVGNVYGYIRYEIKRCDLGHEHERQTEDTCWGYSGSDLAYILYESGVSTDSKTVTLREGWTEHHKS